MACASIRTSTSSALSSIKQSDKYPADDHFKGGKTKPHTTPPPSKEKETVIDENVLAHVS